MQMVYTVPWARQRNDNHWEDILMHTPRMEPIFSQPLVLELMVATLLLGTALLWQAWRPVGLWQMLGWSSWSLPVSVLAALPPLLMIPLLESSLSQRLRWLRIFRENVTSLLAPFFGHLRWPEMLAMAFLAGLSEEVFFRGVLQQEIGLICTSVVFGLFHMVSFPYIVWATLTGLYLGWLLQLTQNLWILIFTHTLVDIVGLGYIKLVVIPRCIASLTSQDPPAPCRESPPL
jgi:membrane protease YdiL (CAAX protease family)